MKKIRFLLFIYGLLFYSIVAAQNFVHPGGLHTQEDLDRMKTKVAGGAHPWIDGWNKLIQDPLAQNTYRASPRANMNLRQVMSKDAHAAYLNAIRWYISGDNSYADCAIRIFNDYSSTLNQVPSGGTTDIVGLGGIGIAELAMAGEIMRISERWAESDFNRFKDMMVNYLYPVCHDFLTNHRGACIDYYWANWDANNIGALVAIGVLCDNQEIFNEGIEYFKNGAGTGSIKHAVPYIHASEQPYGLGQWQEAGRDQTHGFLGVGLLATVCQIAWNQGIDLYGYDNNRLLAGAEYVAQYNLWKDVPFTTYNNCQPANNKWPSINGRGIFHDRPVYELIYNHYVVRKGLAAPNTQLMAELMRPEGGSLDHFGYGSLTFALEPSSASVHPIPPAPASIKATPGVWRVDIEWEPPAGHAVRGYRLQRSTSAAGPYETIAEWDGRTTAKYTDWNAVNGTTYYYRVAGKNQAGMGEYSAVSNAATPQNTGELPLGWVTATIGNGATASASYADVMAGTFKVTGSGTDLGGTADNFGYTYTRANGDIVITTRISQGNGALKKGLMIRETLARNAKTVSMTLGDGGGRFARMGFRNAEGASMSYIFGNTYTWYPAWFRIERVGDTFKAYESSDGIKWFTVGTTTVSMNSQVYVGYIVCTGSQTNSATITFDNVSVVSEGTTAPAAPENLTATVGNTQISLSWDSLSNASGYNVKRATTSGGPYTTVTTGLTETSYTDTGLENGTTYYYVVTAANFAGESQNSTEVSMAPVLTLAPVPVGVVSTSVSATQINLVWEASVSAESYNVKRSGTSGGPYTTIANPSATSFSDTTVDASTWYYVVSAVNSLGESDNSEEVSATPGRVAYWNLDETSGTRAADSWGVAHGALHSGANWTPAIVNNGVKLDGSSNGYVSLGSIDMSKVNDMTIATWVRFDEKPKLWGRLFDIGSGTNLANTMYLVPNTADLANGKNTIRFAIYNGGSTSSKLEYNYEWQAGAWTHLVVTQSGSTAKMYINGAFVAQATFDRNPSNLGNTNNNNLGRSQRGTADPFLKCAIDEFRVYNRVLSDAEIFEMSDGLVPPAPPTILSVSIDTQQASLSWTDVSGATGYNVKRAAQSGGPYTTIGTVAATSFIDSSVNNSSIYYYVVSAINELGESNNSEEESTEPGRVAYWNFDETSGTTAKDSWGTANATLRSGASWTSAIVNNGVQLDGTSNGYVSLGAMSMTGKNDITISSWVKFDEKPTQWGRIFDIGSGTNLGNTMFLIPNTADLANGKNTIRFAIYNGGSTTSRLTYDYEWKLGAWTHIAVTQSGNTAKMYIDGVFVAQATFSRKPSDLGNTTNNNLGRSQRGTADPFLKGSFDEFRIYDRALSDAEILEMTKVPPVKPSVLSITGDTQQVSLTWTEIPGATGYNVKRATESGGLFTTIENVTGTSFSDATLTDDEVYYYVVSAVNENGESANSAEVKSSVSGKTTYLKMDELSGTTADDSWANSDGNVLGDANWSQGIEDNGLQLDGSDDYVALPDGLMKSINDFTIATWVRLDEVVSWARIFDFGTGNNNSMFLTPQTATSGEGIRFAIKTTSGYPTLSYNHTWELDTWTHIAVTLSGDTATMYINGEQVASNTEFTKRPSNLGNTTNNYLGKGQNNDPYLKGSIDNFKIYNRALSAEEVVEAMKIKQAISFDTLVSKIAGDPKFSIEAHASSGLPVRFTSSDTSVARVVGDTIYITGVGTTDIIAHQDGDNLYSAAEPVAQSFTVLPLNLKVLHKDGDRGKTTNNSIMPHLKIENNDTIGVAYREITVRYWFTAENYAGINTWIDYAQLGSGKVSMNYVSLPEPHEGAFGYIEYGFDASLGDLLPGNGSGPIESRFANTDWSNFDETGDYSFLANSSYVENKKITLYRNGQLVWGTEPAQINRDLSLKVYSENKNANTGTNAIRTYLKLANEGNVPVDYKDLSIRYWFTKDSEADLTYWIDYAKLGKSHLLGQFGTPDTSVNGADTYFELSADSTTGTLYPLSSTGEIHLRIAKTGWSGFDESDDHSWLSKAPLAENKHITVYYKGELVYGVEPGTGNLRIGLNQSTSGGKQQLPFSELSVYPNPVADKLTILWNSENTEEVQITLHSCLGTLLLAKKVSGNRHELDLSAIPHGVYIITLTSSGKSVIRKIVKD